VFTFAVLIRYRNIRDVTASSSSCSSSHKIPLLKACTECQRRGSKGTHRAPLQRYDVGVPFQRLCVDVMGPYRVTSNGNRYLITVLDQFTKWPEALPVPSVRSETIASTLLYQVFSRFGIPLEIHSDRAPNFSSELYGEIMRLLGIRRTRTTPLHPSANSVERYNRTLKEHLTLMINETKSDWDQQAQLFLMGYRAHRTKSPESPRA